MKNNSLIHFGLFILTMILLIILVFVDIPLVVQLIIALIALICFIVYNRNENWMYKFKESMKKDLSKITNKIK